MELLRGEGFAAILTTGVTVANTMELLRGEGCVAILTTGVTVANTMKPLRGNEPETTETINLGRYRS